MSAKKMRKWLVEVPIAGVVRVEVDARSEAEAIRKAIEEFDGTPDDIEWELHEKLVEGNVCNAPVTEASAEPVDEDS